MKHLTEVRQIEAHESEVLCLEYSQWRHGPKVLASSSRDRLVHVYDTEQHYGLLQTLSDHSSSISAVKFTETDGQLKMLTCGADKSILFRNLQEVNFFLPYPSFSDPDRQSFWENMWKMEKLTWEQGVLVFLIGSIDDSQCDRMYSSVTVDPFCNNGFVGKQPVA